MSRQPKHFLRGNRKGVATLDLVSGFTLLEVIIVVGIAAFLSGLLLVYNRSSDNSIALSVEQARVVGILNRAKAFTLERNLIKGGENICGFGVSFAKGRGEMTLFRALPFRANCASGFVTQGAGTVIETVVLHPRIEFARFAPQDGDTYAVVFTPPYLKTVNPGTITLRVKGKTDTLMVEVGAGGEVTAL